jgi:hypothetical protein
MRNTPNDVKRQLVAVEMVEHDHTEGRRRRSFSACCLERCTQ